jgi:hypothetical protein
MVNVAVTDSVVFHGVDDGLCRAQVVIVRVGGSGICGSDCESATTGSLGRFSKQRF